MVWPLGQFHFRWIIEDSSIHLLCNVEPPRIPAREALHVAKFTRKGVGAAFAAALLTIGGPATGIAHAAPTDEVVFPDGQLESCVRTALRVSAPTPITEADMTNLTRLTCDHIGIYTGEPLRSATNLTWLSLRWAHLTDVSFIDSLPELTYLDLHFNSPDSLDPIIRHPKLESLGLSATGVTDLTELSSMSQLTTLDLSGNEIDDLSPLGRLTNLTELRAWHVNQVENHLMDVSFLANLTNLELLDISENQVNDISALAGLTKLKHLEIQDGSISSLESLRDIATLETAYFSNNQISDFSPLGDKPDLETWGGNGQEIDGGQVFASQPITNPVRGFDGSPVALEIESGNGTLDGDTVTWHTPGEAGIVSWYVLGPPQPYPFPNSSFSGQITYEVVAAPAEHTVTFDSAGGSAVEPRTVPHDQLAPEPPAPTRDGYTFTGWLLNGTAYKFDVPVTEDITLTAAWQKTVAPGPTEPTNPVVPEPEDTQHPSPTRPGGTSGNTQTAAQGLANTGDGQAAWLIGAGAVFLAGGAALSVISRRRTHSASS